MLKTKTNRKYKLNFFDMLLLFTIIFQDAGTFGILPLNFFQIIVLLMGIVFVIKSMIYHIALNIPKKILILTAYAALITVIYGFDFDCVKSLIYFCIQLIIFYWYIKSVGDYKKILKIIYLAAFILATYGIIQELGYLLRIPALYDIAFYGFAKNGAYTTSFGLLRTMSLYAEPAHLSSIVAAGILIGLVGNDEKYGFTSKIKTLVIFITGLFTASTLLYFSVIVVVLFYTLIYQKKLFKKLTLLLLFIGIAWLFIVFNPGIMSIVKEKLGSMMTGDSMVGSDLSSFAIYSNFKIAFEKLKDGYFMGTGYDTHRLYYYQYIERLYNSVLYYINIGDATSLYIRVFSEFGIVGLVSYLIYLTKRMYKSVLKHDIIMQILVLILVLQGIRNGNYAYVLTSLPFILVLHPAKTTPSAIKEGVIREAELP